MSEASPTRPRAPHGAAPCRGVYHHLHRPSPRDRADRHALRGRLQRALSGRATLAERGYGFLGWNTRFAGDGHRFILEHALIDIGVGVRWLRETAGVENVVLLGNSGGASLDGRVPVASGRAESAPDTVGRAPRRRPRPPAGRRARRAVRALRADPTCSPLGSIPSVTDEADPLSRRPVARHVRSRRTARPTHQTSSSAIAPPSKRATSGSPTGSSRNTNG